MDYRVLPARSVTGCFTVPGDKSISHRSIILGAVADGVTRITGFLEGEDCLATKQAFERMGVRIEGPDNGRVVIHGAGLHGLRAPQSILDLGNSGTSMRLLTGLLAGQSFASELIGDHSLMQRPMKRVQQPLAEMGAQIDTSDTGTPPVKITPVAALHGIRYEVPVPSAQVKSAILLAGLYAEGVTEVVESVLTRDHTERMLRDFGAQIESRGTSCHLQPAGSLQGCEIQIPGDLSSAAFFIVAACIGADSELVLKNVGVNPTRTGLIDILITMGADIHLDYHADDTAEPIADIRVRSSELHGINVPAELVPSAIDEFPVLCIAAACANGTTVFRQAAELRVKESDRIRSVAKGLKTLGIEVQEYPDGLAIQGGGFRQGAIDSVDDHRIAMAFTMASLRAQGPIEIQNCANVATSFPNFADLARRAGLNLSIHAK